MTDEELSRFLDGTSSDAETQKMWNSIADALLSKTTDESSGRYAMENFDDETKRVSLKRLEPLQACGFLGEWDHEEMDD